MGALNYIILILFALHAYSCSQSKREDEPVSRTGGKEYLPVAKENTWEYAEEGKDSLAYTVKVEEIALRQGNITASVSSFPYLLTGEGKQTLILKETGEMSITSGEGDVNFFPPVQNLKKDYTWAAGIWHAVVTGINETVTAGGKTYTNCVHISYSLSITFAADIWFAPGAGIVKWGLNRTNPPTQKFIYYTTRDISLK
jgi:hypothetical protein